MDEKWKCGKSGQKDFRCSVFICKAAVFCTKMWKNKHKRVLIFDRACVKLGASGHAKTKTTIKIKKS